MNKSQAVIFSQGCSTTPKKSCPSFTVKLLGKKVMERQCKKKNPHEIRGNIKQACAGWAWSYHLPRPYCSCMKCSASGGLSSHSKWTAGVGKKSLKKSASWLKEMNLSFYIVLDMPVTQPQIVLLPRRVIAGTEQNYESVLPLGIYSLSLSLPEA